MNRLLHFALGLSLNFSSLLAQVPEWQHIPGPDGGSIVNFDLDGSSLYALTQAGIYRSEDEGYQWTLLPKSLTTTRGKYQLRADKGIFYALDEDGALVRSDDQGESWKPVLQKPFPFDFETEHLQQVFVKGDTLLVGSYFTIYRSVDKGESWTTTADLVPASFVSIFEYKNELFAAQDRYIYRSSDGGATWNTVFTNFIGYADVVATDSALLAFYADQTRLVRSSDGFRNWDAIDTDILGNSLEASTNNWVSGTGDTLYFFQGLYNAFDCPIKFCYSTDSGDTWHQGNNGEHVKIGRSFNGGILFGNHLVLASDQIQHSIDGGLTFTESQVGLKTGQIHQIIHQGSTVFANDGSIRNLVSHDGGETWSGYPRSALWEDYCYASEWFHKTNEKVFRFLDYPYEASYTQNGGSSWSPLTIAGQGYTQETEHALWLTVATWDGSKYVNDYWKISDGDTTLTPIQLTDSAMQQPLFELTNLGDKFGVSLQEDFLIFDENGALIQKLPASHCIPTFSWCGRLYFDGNTYYNLCGSRTFIFPPNATDWQEIYPQDWTTGIPLYHSNMTFFEPHNGILWVGLEGKGLFYATDNTGRFYPAQPQMPYPYPTSVSFDENSIWVGTAGGGIWTYPLPKVRNDQAENPGFTVFPNPSGTGDLSLQSELFVKEEITFSLLDASGWRIAQKVLTPGQYWSLDFPKLPRGLYFLQMRTESGVFGLKWTVLN